MSDVSKELIAQHLAVTFHMIFVSVCVGGIATDATLYTLIASDFIINNYFAVMTWRAKRNFTQKIKFMKEFWPAFKPTQNVSYRLLPAYPMGIDQTALSKM